MRADSDVLHDEAKGKLKEAMVSYPGDPVHVTIYVLHLSDVITWNQLQTALSRSSHPSRPQRISQICSAVDEHLELELRDYLGITK